jgi:hypothetical protein
VVFLTFDVAKPLDLFALLITVCFVNEAWGNLFDKKMNRASWNRVQHIFRRTGPPSGALDVHEMSDIALGKVGKSARHKRGSNHSSSA